MSKPLDWLDPADVRAANAVNIDARHCRVNRIRDKSNLKWVLAFAFPMRPWPDFAS